MRLTGILIGMLALGSAVRAESGGAPEGSTGAPGEAVCTACHGGSANAGSGKLTIDPGGPSYTPGQKVRVKVTLEDPAASRWGFQLTARPEGDTRATAGKLAAVDGNTQVRAGGALEWITHTLTGTRRGQRNTATFEFDWTAPASDVGPVVFYAAGNAANGNNNADGDSIYAANLKVTAAIVSQKPAFTSTSVAEAWTGKQGIAPGAWISITGMDLAAQEANWAPASGRPIDTKLGGVTVKVNDVPAVLSFVSPTKISLLVPGATPKGDVSIVIDRDGTASDAVVVQAGGALPAIQSVLDAKADPQRYYASVTAAGAGAGLALINAKGWVLGKPDVDSRAVRGVVPGEEIDIYAIGLGKADPEFPTDKLFTGSFAVTGTVTVRFGEQSVTPTASVLVAPGLYAVRVKTPESLSAGDVTLAIDVDGVTSAGVLLNVQK